MEGFDYSPWVLQAEGGVHRADTASPGEPPTEALIQSVIPTGHGNSVDRPWRGVVTNDGWKLAVFEKTPWLMFNLTDDPMELVNLAHNPRYHHERRRLYQKLERLLEKVGDDFELGEF
jgi:arylsulfatase A-like enzyme